MSLEKRTICKIWKDKSLRKIFLDIIYNTQFRNCSYLKDDFFNVLHSLVKKNFTDDLIYNYMFDWVHSSLSQTSRDTILKENIPFRSINRADKIKSLINKFYTKKDSLEILDVGCAEGSITIVIGQYLQLEPSKIHGCDIVDTNNNTKKSFTFTHLSDNNTDNNNNTGKLPYNNEQFDIVIALMSLHHMQHRDFVIEEIHRILKHDGLFIIREHNCINKGLALVLDVIHGFYSMVWANPREMNDFNTHYFANYTKADTLTNIITTKGFIELYNNRFNEYPRFYHSKIINPLNYYYAVYRKNEILI